MARGNAIGKVIAQDVENRKKKEQNAAVVKPGAKTQISGATAQTDTGSNGVKAAQQSQNWSQPAPASSGQEKNPFEKLIDLATSTPQWQQAAEQTRQYQAAEQTAREKNLPSQNAFWMSMQAPQPEVQSKEQEEKKDALDRFVNEMTQTRANEEPEQPPQQESDLVKNMVGRGIQALQDSPGAYALGNDMETLNQQLTETQKLYQRYQDMHDFYANQQAEAESHLFYATDDADQYNAMLQNAKAQQAKMEEGMAAVQKDLDRLSAAISMRESLDTQYMFETSAQEADDFTQRSQTGAERYKERLEDEREANEKRLENRKNTSSFLNYLADGGAGADTTLPLGTMQASIDAMRRGVRVSSLEVANDVLETLSEEQQNIFFYWYATNQEIAWEYLDYAEKQEKNRQLQELQRKSGSSFGNALLATGEAAGLNLLSGADYLGALAEYTATGEVGAHQPNVSISELRDARRGGVAQKLNEAGTIGGKGLGDLYQLGTSMLDSTIAAVTGNAVPMFFMSAASSGYQEAKERGSSEEQALLYGAASGVAECLFEELSIEKLLSQDLTKGFWKNVLQQAGVEASEELATSLANTVNDAWINREYSKYNTQVTQYMQNGMSAGQARAAATNDLFMDLAYDAVGGALSGGLMTAGHYGVNAASNAIMDRRLGGSWLERSSGQGLNETSGPPLRTEADQQQASTQDQTHRENAFQLFKQNAEAGIENAQNQQTRQDSEAGRFARDNGMELEQAEELFQLGQDWGIPAQDTSPKGSPKTQRRHTAAETRRINEQAAQSIARQAADNGWFDEQLSPQAREENRNALIDFVMREYGVNPTKAARLVNGALTDYFGATDTFGQNQTLQPEGLQPLSAEEQTVRDIARETGMSRNNAQGYLDLANEWGVADRKGAGDATQAQSNGTSSASVPSAPSPQGEGLGAANTQQNPGRAAPLQQGAGAAGGIATTAGGLTMTGGTGPQEGRTRPINVDRAQAAQGVGGRRVSEAYGTITNSPAVPDEFTSRVLQPAKDNGDFSMTPDTNKNQLERGRSWVDSRLASNTVEATVAEWSQLVASGGNRNTNTKTLQAAGYSLLSRLSNAAQNPSYSDAQRAAYDRAAVQVATNLQKVATNAAQLLQMQTMLKKLSPEMQVYSVKSAVDQINQTLQAKGIQVEAKQQLVDALQTALQSGDEAAIADARENLYRDIASQMPMNVRDKLNAWRYLCMLGNPTTIIRNFMGNLGFAPVKAVSGKMQAAVQSFLQKTNVISQEQRTKYGGALLASEQGRAALRWGREYAKQLDSELSGEGKYARTDNAGTGIERAWHEYNSEFKNPVLKAWQKATEFGLNSSVMGDALFLTHHFGNEMAQMIMARGYTVGADGNLYKGDTQLTQSQIDDMSKRAVEAAKKATYRDTNAFVTFCKKMRSYSENGAGGKIRNLLVDSVFPFISTPANIIVRSVEYSPIGLAKTLLTETGKLSRGDIDVTDYVGHLCDGLTGTGIVALGAYLAAQGILTGAGVDDDDKREGRQKYSLNILGQHIPIDWLAPEAATLLSGATLWESFQDKDNKGLDALYKTIGDYMNPLIETSMLSGVSELLESGSYTPDRGVENLLYALTINNFMNYASQYIPTMWGKATASARDEKSYVYTGDVEGNINKQWARTWGNFEKKLGVDVFGGNTRLQPTLDDWGRNTETGTVPERLAQNYLLPWSATEDRSTPRDSEIRAVNDELRAKGLESQTQSVGPSKRGYTVTVKNAETGESETIRLNGDQYTNYQREYGQSWAQMFDELLTDERYQSMSATEKRAMLDKLDTVANEYGKAAAGVGYETDDKIVGMMEDGLSFADAYELAQWQSSAEDGGDRYVDASEDSAELWAYSAGLPSGMERTELTEEMRRLFEANGENRYFSASSPDDLKNADGESVKLTDEQREQFMGQRGTVYENLANQLMEDQRYQNASDEDKLAMLQQAYEIAGEAAKDSLGVGYQPTSKEYSLLQTGLSTADIYAAKEYHDEVNEMLKETDNEDLNTQRISVNARAATFKAWVENQDWTREQKDAVLEDYGTFFSMRGSDTNKYDALTANGLSGDQAAELIRTLGNLTPLEGATDVTDAQKWEAIVNSDLSPEQKNTALWMYMNDSQRTKFETFLNSGLGAEEYYKIATDKKKYGNKNGNWDKNTLPAYLNAQGYSAAEKYWIYEVFGTTKYNKYSAAAPAENKQGGIPAQAEEAEAETAQAESGSTGGNVPTVEEAAAAARENSEQQQRQQQIDAALKKQERGQMLTEEEFNLLLAEGLLDTSWWNG